MANYITLKTAIQVAIKTNNNNEITGKILQQQLLAMINSLGSDYQLAGILRPSDTPKTDDQRIAYLAVEPGTYTQAGGFNVTELSLLTYDTAWKVHPLGVPFGSQIAADITAAVDAEKTRAMAAEKALNDAIAAEASARKAADNALTTKIETEVSDRKAADAILQGNINTEESERKAADQTLQDNINAEKTRATTAEATLTKNINTEAFERKAADTALDTRVASIEDKIPAQATAENKLADKEFVNSSIATATATFRGTFDALEALKATTADKNDYAFWVHKDEDGNTCYDKYTYTGTEWLFEYRLNNSSFTAAQWAALNSGVTADVIKALQDADKANAKAIADEKVAREQADTANAEALATETAERKAVDQTLQSNIDKKIFYIDYSRTAESIYSSNVKGIDVANAVKSKNIILLRRDDGLVSFPSTVYMEVDYIDIYWNDGPNDEGVWTCVEFVWNDLNSLPGITEYENLIWSQKQDTISDLATIRTQATHGQTAFSWGDHAKAGYIKPFIMNLSGDGSAENPYAIDKTFEEIVAARSANSLILLNDGSYLYVASPFDINPDGMLITFAVTWADDGALWAYYIDASPQKMDITHYDFGYIQSGSLATINGKSVENGGDIKVGVPTIQAGQGNNAEVFNGNPPGRAAGNYSHAEGENTQANGRSSHTEGSNTIADCPHSHAEGTYNVEDLYAIHSVGIGTSNTARKDAHRITYDGKHYIPGIGGFDGTKATEDLNGEKDLATVINELKTAASAKPLVITLTTGTGSINDPYKVDKRVQDVQNAIDAKSLIYLYDPTTKDLYPAMYIAHDVANVNVYFAVTWADDNALWAFYLGTNAAGELYVERYDFSYVVASVLAKINGKSLINSGENIKVGEPPVILNYNGLDGNKAPDFRDPATGRALTREQICALLNGVDANRVILQDMQNLPPLFSTAKVLKCRVGSTADLSWFIIGFDAAQGSSIYDILFRWDMSGKTVLRAELLANQ